MIAATMSSAHIALITAFLSFGGGIASSYLMFRGQRLKASVESKAQNNTQIGTIFDGYSQIVEDLQHEVDRLKKVIDDLRIEQDECEKRNALLREELVDLRSRIMIIEQREAEHHGEQ